ATKYINEIKEIVKIPVPEWTYFENTKTVWGVYFNQGVAFTDSVEVSYTDSTLSYVYHEKTNIIKDTVTSSQTITGTIQYFDIPLQIHYTKPLGKVSVGAFAGARFGILNKSKVLVNTDFKYAQPP